MSSSSLHSSDALATLNVAGTLYQYYSLHTLESQYGSLARLPVSLKILLENILRCQGSRSSGIQEIAREWMQTRAAGREIAFMPSRVLMQDFTGVPAVADLAAMRDALQAQGGDPARVNPVTPVDLVIDHSVMVDAFGTPGAFAHNTDQEYARNKERYAFLRWAQGAFANFRVVPPGMGICHQVNLEYLSQVVSITGSQDIRCVFPDTVVGTDSHTTMINGLGVLGWGVGGIEAEAVMLGQPISMRVPEVVGCVLTGTLPPGATATDLVLTLTQRLRAHGVVGKFVEFFGTGLSALTLADRATVANMAPEYGATCGFFPVDAETLRYLALTGRSANQIALIEAYTRAQGLWHDPAAPAPLFTTTLSLDLSTVVPCVAGPRRPQDRIPLDEMAAQAPAAIAAITQKPPSASGTTDMGHGSVVIAAITSCTNTSNPSVMLGAALLAHKARARGLTVPAWVKTSLAPGSQVVMDYLEQSGYLPDLEALGFHLVGYGCTTCIGNSGPLPPEVSEEIESRHLAVAAVLSGNRNFEGRIHPQIPLNYLMSPALVVAYALAGSICIDLTQDPLGQDPQGNPVYLRDIWPQSTEVEALMHQSLSPSLFASRYASVSQGDAQWQALDVHHSLTYPWDQTSTYIKRPPFFDSVAISPALGLINARPLAILGDSVTTDHISPAGSIKPESPAGLYLQAQGVAPLDFNSYGARRGNHEVMVRGTLANGRLRNEMVPGIQGGVTRSMPSGDVTSIYQAAQQYAQDHVPLIIIAGKEYGTGSSRDWAAKGTRLLGVKAVIAESFERIHRSNLIGMGVLPLKFMPGTTRLTLELMGDETLTLQSPVALEAPEIRIPCRITRSDGHVQEIVLQSCLETPHEMMAYRHGGVLQHVLQGLRQQG